jgi:hypothetical protein
MSNHDPLLSFMLKRTDENCELETSDDIGKKQVR